MASSQSRRGRGTSLVHRLVSDAEPSDLAVQAGSVDPEKGCGPLLVPLALFQRPQDEVALHLVERGPGALTGAWRRQVAGRCRRAVGSDDVADQSLELVIVLRANHEITGSPSERLHGQVRR